MLGVRFVRYIPPADGRTDFEKLLPLFLELLTHTSGDLEEALNWMDELNKEHGFFNNGYTRKDFDPTIGLAVVIAGAVVSGVFYWFGRDVIAYSILAAAALIDLIVYGRLKEVTVCYRCHTEFRGAYLRTAPAFDLHTADVLEKEYERKIGRR